ncbi:aminopeptidase O isoform X3 [Hyperolius riggenbachi]|uniref:aminopeptidase O isoform X3 n=1 Tax=Hyperolius riggenbachi TaxID=752182 RepID=UPI0035A39637
MDQDTDDLPLMANTSHILVKHFAVDLDVCFDSQTISGNVVLFLQPAVAGKDVTEKSLSYQSNVACGGQESKSIESDSSTALSHSSMNDSTLCAIGKRYTSDKCDHYGNRVQISDIMSSQNCCGEKYNSNEDFILVLDCSDLSILKVEEVNINAVACSGKSLRSTLSSQGCEQQLPDSHHVTGELAALPDSTYKEQLSYYAQCSRAPPCGELLFTTDTWSLQIIKPGVKMQCEFPPAIRIWYKTTANGRSVKWTKDQSGRPCVYTFGSPINNRALFPCQEPPVAMSTWHATVQADSKCIVLMSGENFASPSSCSQGLNTWFYYVTMPMPASTFTIAVGSWKEVKEDCTSEKRHPLSHYIPLHVGDNRSKPECQHAEYPCRYRCPEAYTQMCIPYRVFTPDVLLDRCKDLLLHLLPRSLEAANAVLGTHPFSRLDVLIVPDNFSSLGMASPHIIYLSQSVLSGRLQLCMTRVCHEIAHAWFGLAIGARDWTEEWISEGFATHLEDVFSAKVQKLTQEEANEQHELKALLRWRRLNDELSNSQQELQILRPQGDSTGEVSDSGASAVRHGLNPDKAFMQVHYLKEFLHMLMEHFPEQQKQGLSVELIYKIWLDIPGMPQPLLEQSQTWEENRLVQQVKEEVSKWTRLHKRNRRSIGRKRQQEEEFNRQLLPDQLVLLLDLLLEENTLCTKTLQCLERTYSLQEHDAEVRHRWCELVVKHKYTAAYKDVEQFLLQDQAMGVYLYGELMLNEDARQQELAHRCFAVVKDQMDASCVKVVGEMLF